MRHLRPKVVVALLIAMFFLTTFILFKAYCQPEKRIDVTTESGLSDVLALANEFKTSGNTNALKRLGFLVDNPKYGANAAAALRDLATKIDTADIKAIVIPALIKGIEHTNRFVNREATLTISEFAAHAQSAVPYLRKALRGDNDTSVFAVKALGKIGLTSIEALPDLIGVLERPETATGGFEDGSIRVYAAQAIGRIGLADAKARQSVERGLSDINPFVSVTCAQALLQNGIAVDEAVKTLAHQMKSPDLHLRRFVIVILGELRTVPTSLYTELREALSDPDPEIQAAVRGLLNRSNR